MEIVYCHFIVVLLHLLFERCKYNNYFLQSITNSLFFISKYKILVEQGENKTIKKERWKQYSRGNIRVLGHFHGSCT
jgi:hypothetical protein